MIFPFLKISLVLGAETSALLVLLSQSHTVDSLAAYFALHAVASGGAVWMAWALLPSKLRQPAIPTYALLYSLAFFIPILGVVATVIAVQIAQRFPKIWRTERYVTVTMPEFSEVQQEATERSDLRVSDARRILKDHTLPLETRLRVLVALQSMRPKATIPLLQSLLADPSEDIRLLAYSMVEAWEKDLSQQILEAMNSLRDARAGDERAPLVNALQRLAELHWLQADSGLARGDLKIFALEQAQQCCEDVLILDGYVPSVWHLYAQVLIELDRLPGAVRALQLARSVRMPEQEVWPMLAQISFVRRDLSEVRRFMGHLPDDAKLPYQLRGMASFWRRPHVSWVDIHV